MNLLRRASWRAVAVCILMSIVACLPLPIQASEDSATVRVVVVDARTHQPVRLARVFLSGADATFGYADQAGVTTFEHVRPGAYQLDVSRVGYRAQQNVSLDVASGGVVTVEVLLASSTDLQTIGSVSTTTRRSIAPDDVQSSGASTRLSQGLADALGTLPAVSGANGAFSIGGHSPLQTGYQIDGVPIPGLSSSGGAGGIDPDLFSGASVTQGAGNGSAAGTINFRTLDPTVAFRADGSMSYDSADSSAAVLSARGTIGYAGVVVAHASRGMNGTLNGLTFADASGSTYLHNQGNEQRGELVKLRLPFGTAQSITGTIIRASSQADIVCDRFVAAVPCGFGPGNLSGTVSQTNIVNYLLQAGVATIGVGASTFTARHVTDESRRMINGLATPYSDAGRVTGSSVSVNGIIPVGTHHTFGLTASTFQYRVSARSGGSTGSSNATVGDRYGRIELQDVFDAGRGATLSTTAGTSSSGLTHHDFVREAVRYAPGKRNSYQLALSSGESGTAATTLPVNGDAASLVYDCAAGVVFGQTAGDQLDEPTIREAWLTWQNRGPRATIALSTYVQQQRGGTVATFVPGSAADASVLTPQFLSDVNAFFATPSGCGRPATITPSRILLYQSVAVDSLVFSGTQFSASTTVGRGLVIGAFAAYERAAAFGSDSRFRGPTSIVRPGAQLPNVPLLRATGIADYRVPGSKLEGLALLQYASGNNANNLPPYTTLSLGIGLESPRTSFTLAVRNVANTHARTFVSALDSMPLPTFGGGSLPTLSTPLPPRTLQALYSVRLGPDRIARRAAVEASLAGASEDSVSIPLRILPAAPLADPLAPNIGDARCTPEVLPTVHRLYDVFRRAFVLAEAERKRTGAYPQTLAVSVPNDVHATISYVRTRQHFVLTFTIQGSTLRAFSRCASVALTDAGDVRDNDLATLSPDASGATTFGLSPALGFYTEPAAPRALRTADVGHIRTIDEAVADPFALRGTCPSNFRPVAEDIVARMRARLSGRPDSSAGDAADVVIAARSEGFSHWYEVRFPSMLQAAAFQACADVASATGQDLRSRGYGATPLPTINYAEPFGFYSVHP